MTDEIVSIEESGIADLLAKANVMHPATCIGANVQVGVKPYLETDDPVAILELLILAPTEGDDTLAIMPIVMTPELAESLGLSVTGEDNQ